MADKKMNEFDLAAANQTDINKVYVESNSGAQKRAKIEDLASVVGGLNNNIYRINSNQALSIKGLNSTASFLHIYGVDIANNKPVDICCYLNLAGVPCIVGIKPDYLNIGYVGKDFYVQAKTGGYITITIVPIIPSVITIASEGTNMPSGITMLSVPA